MRIDILQVGFLKTNCYIVSNEASGECVVIDPGSEGKRIISFINDHGLILTGILLTHCHADHVAAMWPLYEFKHVPVYLNERDTASIVNLGPFRFVPTPDCRFLKDGDTVELAGMSFLTIVCPGHTPGGLSFVCGDYLFCGDTLFHMSWGRCDYPCSSRTDLSASLCRLRLLPDHLRLMPGHGEISELGYEKEHNCALRNSAVLLIEQEDEENWNT